ncbi:hypothetical protein C8J36_11060 [Rhizobium sp. PP-F2F-G48]|uniref:hypothetical protein n=1 Tax=Rhizobium sp. PP-F2F-G48 TaxID=2135651 RepID=UPI00104B0194|nr:hypothetical protein [Rhizobium sp. PP-F2F-G48]TCM51053.1 hypothetical protein C8J36_11060 [Rhizobium sp. PP-F2F-G48]
MISAQSVRDIFDQNGIKHVAIIDDVFDPPGENLSAAEEENLYNSIVALPDLMGDLNAVGVSINEPTDLTSLAIAKIKQLAATGHGSGETIWAEIEAISDGRRVKLDKLAALLKKELKVSVKKISAAKAKKKGVVVPEHSNVIFLDYELEAGKGGGDLSSSFVKRIYQQFKGKDAVPLLILMSSIDLQEAEVAKFQKQSDFLSGMFYFVPKDDLYEVEKLHYRLAAFAQALPTGQVLQKFVECLDSSLQDVRTSVFNDIRSLSIADYAFLQTMRLHEDGQPMGEYLMWMISAHLVKELGGMTAMKTVEKAVSKLSFEHLPPTQAKPSASLGALYSSAVLRPIGDLPDKDLEPENYVQFGDLFRKGTSKNVWVCITPPCDLAFGATRTIPSSRSILFLPGKLMPIDKQLKAFEQRQPRTELVLLNKEMSRIVWDTKSVLQIEWGKLQETLSAMKMKRVARVNTPFALEIQRSFATDLTRIGMPVPPPIYNPVQVQLSCFDETDNERVLTTVETSGAHLTGSDRGEKLVLGAEFMAGLPKMLADASAILDAKHTARVAKAAQLGPGAITNALQAKEKVALARQNASTMNGIRGPFKLPMNGEQLVVLDNLILVHDESEVPFLSDWIPLKIKVVRDKAE